MFSVRSTLADDLLRLKPILLILAMRPPAPLEQLKGDPGHLILAHRLPSGSDRRPCLNHCASCHLPPPMLCPIVSQTPEISTGYSWAAALTRNQ